MSVSVLIPCFNAEGFLAETLESVLRQTHPAAEILAIDDGSSDATFELLRRFGDRVQALQQPNAGASVTRNRLLARAQGEYLQFLDADDLLAPDAIALRLAHARRTNANAVCGNWRKFSGDGAERRYRAANMQPIEAVSSDAELATFTTFWAPPAAWLFRADLVRAAGGFRVDLPVIQDARLLQDCAHLGARFGYVDQILADYREARVESLSQRSRLAFLNDCRRNGEQIMARWQAQMSLDNARREALANCFDFVARGLFLRDPDGFDRAYAALRALNCRGHTWPRIAANLKRAVGLRAATTILRSLRRAPELP